MNSLSALDSMFLYSETNSAPMNVLGVLVIGPGAEGPPGFEQIARLVAERLPRLALFRRRLVEAPLGLTHPLWIEDPDFDLHRHLRRTRAPAPGGEPELAEVVGLLARGRLERSRPLWQLWTIKGLAEGRTALVIKVHHALADGVSGAALLASLLDLPGVEFPDVRNDPWTPEAIPTRSELVGRSLWQLARRPQARLNRVRRGGRAALRVAQAMLGEDGLAEAGLGPFAAPPTPFNRKISPFRKVAYARAELEPVRLAKAVFGATINEVVLTACTMSLRAWLRERDALPQRPLVAAVPVSTRGSGAAPGGNELSAFLVTLPVQLADPVEQLAVVRRSSRQAKRLHQRVGEDSIQELAESAPPLVARSLAQLYARTGLAHVHPPFYNLVVSNVPGPPSPLSLSGIPVQAIHPHGPVFDGAGLNLTVVSYAGSIDLGAIACRQSVPGLETIASGFADAVHELGQLASVEASAANSGDGVAEIPIAEVAQEVAEEIAQEVARVA
jgi:diacylglycerol O-acyltransferase